jgi:hypothetical protein
MRCPLCHQRNARRACPARGDEICAVCCATKRLVEIACPADCVYLASAQRNPPAPVRRQQEADVRALADTLGRLSERQYRLGFLLLTFVGRYQPSGLARMEDTDVAEAAATLAATYETAGRGVIYEHTAASTTAAGLAAELKTFLTELGRGAGATFEREAAEVLRAIERGARAASPVEGGRAYLDLVARVVPKGGRGEAHAIAPADEAPKLIIP